MDTSISMKHEEPKTIKPFSKMIAMRERIALLFTAFFLFVFSAHAQTITTIAGDDTAGYNGDGIPAVFARLNNPFDVAFDMAGNVYIADSKNNRIRKINTSGIISTIAGTGVAGYNGDNIAATDAKLNLPSSIAFDGSGSLFITDDNNFRVRKINTAGIITTIAGTGVAGYTGDNGMATAAKIDNCFGIAVDGSGNIYIDDGSSSCIRKITSAGVISTIGGTGYPAHSGDGGPATAAGLAEPNGLALDNEGNIYFAEYSGSCIRKISTSGIITTIAGSSAGLTGYSGDGGPATAAKLYYPFGVGVDKAGSIYIADMTNGVIRKVDNSGIISTIAGNGAAGHGGDGGNPLLAELYSPSCVKVDAYGSIYIGDASNNNIRYIKSLVFVAPVKVQARDIHIYPNPSHGCFSVSIASGNTEPVRVVITNAIGEKVKETNGFTNKAIQIQLNVPVGIYFVTALTRNDRWGEQMLIR